MFVATVVTSLSCRVELCRVRDCPEDWRTFNASPDRQDGYLGEVGEAVRSALIEQGVKSNQLEVVAFGAAIPIGLAGEAINRRVEIEPKTRWQ